MESKLPLNIPFLLKVGYPDGKYILHGRAYSDIEWFGEGKPSIDDLEQIYKQLDAQQGLHNDFIAKSVKEAIKSPHAVRAEALLAVAPHLEEVVKYNNAKLEEVAKEILKEKLDAESERSAKESQQHWIKLKDSIRQRSDEAIAYLHSTDWYVIRKHELDKEIPADVLFKRAAARESIQKAQAICGDLNKLKDAEYPTKYEMAEALRGGSVSALAMLARIKALNANFK